MTAPLYVVPASTRDGSRLTSVTADERAGTVTVSAPSRIARPGPADSRSFTGLSVVFVHVTSWLCAVAEAFGYVV